MIRIAVIGCGHWGPNLVRNFAQTEGSELAALCDQDAHRLSRVSAKHPGVRSVARLEEVLADDTIDAVVLATPAKTHYDLGMQCLSQGKHLLVEKPLALTVEGGEALVEAAGKQERVLMVGHLMEYHPAVERLKALVDDGKLGQVHYVYCQRLNLGVVRSDENALWSLAPHDVSMILYLLGTEAETVSATGSCHLQEGVEDVVFVTLRFANGVLGHIHVSWLDPHKVRRLTIVGAKQMAVFDDTESTEKLRLYDKGVALNENGHYVGYGQSMSLRFGDILIPKIPSDEPLALECREFVECIRTGREPRSNGADGVRVLRVLEAAQASLRQGGVPTPCSGRGQ